MEISDTPPFFKQPPPPILPILQFYGKFFGKFQKLKLPFIKECGEEGGEWGESNYDPRIKNSPKGLLSARVDSQIIVN